MGSGISAYIAGYRKTPMVLYRNYLFINQRGTPLTRHGINRICKKYLRMTLSSKRLKYISPAHSFRHSCAVRMLSDGTAISDIRNRLGHINIQSTMTYLHMDFRRKARVQRQFIEYSRSLIAQAGVALYAVGGHKVTAGGRIFVSLDGGLADNPRPAMYQARYTALLANRATAPEVETVSLAGPYCESGDILVDSVNLPPVEPGDIIAVPMAGAYHLSMSSNYNGALRPAVVLLAEKKVSLIQRRETFEDLIARDI